MPMYDYQCLNCGKESLIVVTLKEHEAGENRMSSMRKQEAEATF
ncbi:MAG: zinc ribbon domain-containing protein [Nitrospira sp.]|nr:zinc ribbon domain-containing protein [Nitrospira sp.]